MNRHWTMFWVSNEIQQQMQLTLFTL